MKKKIFISLSSDLVARIDQLVGPKSSRSAFIERVVRNYLWARARMKARAGDVARINAAAERLNAEVDDVLSLQA